MGSDVEGSILMQRYELGRLLGQGTFAKVYQARNLKTSQVVAIKAMDKAKVLRAGLIDQIKREISVMRIVQHPHIVHLYEVLASKTKIYLILEYVNGGELFKKITKGKLKEEVARKYFQQLISALDFCHSRGAYHRDLKPENLLLDDDENLKISDFGLSALVESKRQDGLLHTMCGTPTYVAPEIIKRKGYDGDKADIWSCGVILFVLMAGYLPFHGLNLIEMYRKIDKSEFKCPNWFSSDVKRLLSRILDPNPATRISIEKIKESPWFRKGFSNKRMGSEETKEMIMKHIKTDTVYDSSEIVAEGKQDVLKRVNLNAFDIIALSSGFDLSGLFDDYIRKKEVRFISTKPATTITSKIEEIAKQLKLKVKKKNDIVLKMEGVKEGRKGVLAIDAQVFEVTPSFHVVEIKKTDGDTLEYQKIWKNDMRPALKDVIWAHQ